MDKVVVRTLGLISEAHLKNQADVLEKVALRLRNGAEMLDSYINDESLGKEELERLLKRLDMNLKSIDKVKDMLEGAKESTIQMIDRM